ncbi:histamine H3 receptor [Xenopus laevis]|uniref:Histamine H3 receptor n=1 Tax=Xenopus laevis TaxID=8355 RepID=A0A8J0VN72_XENLA|nr:histamine H3 receptor [Xenopus laevis]
MTTLKSYEQTGGNASAANEYTVVTKQSEAKNVLITVLLSLIVVLIVLGNSVVILAFIVDRRLRNRSNFFLLNLAICDFLVGAISITLFIPYTFTGKWMLGKFLCKLWLTIDYTTTTASAYSVVLISYDRFLSVNKAVLHQSLQNRHRQTALNMILIWILSFLVYGPAVLLWEIITGTNNFPEDSCLAGFLETWYFILGASTLDFMLPLLSISFFNLRIYLEILKRSTKRQNHYKSRSSKEKAKDIEPFTITNNTVLSSAQTNEKRQNNSVPCMDLKITSDSPQTPETLDRLNKRNKLSKDKKAAKSLAILVSVFIACWSPYSIFVCIRAACQGYSQANSPSNVPPGKLFVSENLCEAFCLSLMTLE